MYFISSTDGAQFANAISKKSETKANFMLNAAQQLSNLFEHFSRMLNYDKTFSFRTRFPIKTSSS